MQTELFWENPLLRRKCITHYFWHYWNANMYAPHNPWRFRRKEKQP